MPLQDYQCIYHLSAHLDSSNQSSRHPPENNLLFSRIVSLLGSLTVPGMKTHQLQLIIDGGTTCLMDFLNVRKLNLTHDHNQSIPQTRWELPTNLCVSSINPVYALLVYYQRYGEQKSHQNTKQPITPMTLTTVFLIMQLLVIVFFAQISPGNIPNGMTWYNLSMIVIRPNWKKIWRSARMLITQLGMILYKLFRNIGTAFAKRAPVEKF